MQGNAPPYWLLFQSLIIEVSGSSPYTVARIHLPEGAIPREWSDTCAQVILCFMEIIDLIIFLLLFLLQARQNWAIGSEENGCGPC